MIAFYLVFAYIQEIHEIHEYILQKCMQALWMYIPNIHMRFINADSRINMMLMNTEMKSMKDS